MGFLCPSVDYTWPTNTMHRVLPVNLYTLGRTFSNWSNWNESPHFDNARELVCYAVRQHLLNNTTLIHALSTTMSHLLSTLSYSHAKEVMTWQ